MNTAELPFNAMRNFEYYLAIYRLCSQIFFSWTKLRRKITLCSSELSLDTPWNFMRTFKRTFVEKSPEQRTKFAHFACITFAQYCTWSYMTIWSECASRYLFFKLYKRWLREKRFRVWQNSHTGCALLTHPNKLPVVFNTESWFLHVLEIAWDLRVDSPADAKFTSR